MSNVIQIEDMRLTRAERSWSSTERKCKHLNLTMDEDGDIVTCDDCKMQVSAFWALQMLSDHYQRAFAKLQRRYTEQAKVEQTTIHTKAALQVEAAWRSRTMVPTCPNCREPIFATDGFGRSSMSKEIAERRRAEKDRAK